VALLGLCAAHSEGQALWLLIAPSFASGAYVGPCFALVQNLAAVHSRATATALMVFTINLIGAGVGPLLLGALSNHLTAEYGEESLRYAFYSLVPLYGAATLGFALMSSRVKADLEDARLDSLGETGGR
jgi:MFS family permease